MRRPVVGLLAAGVVGLLGVAGCGAADPPATWSGITTLDLSDLADADAQYAWCMTLRSKRLASCHSVVAAQDLVSSPWMLSEDAGKAKEGLAALTGLAARRIEARVS